MKQQALEDQKKFAELKLAEVLRKEAEKEARQKLKSTPSVEQ